MRLRGAVGLVTLSMLLAACGGGSDLLLPGASDPASVTLLQGDGQNGRVGEPLPQPLVAAITDGSGRPVEGAAVVFVLTDPAPGAAVTPDTATTDAEGHATAQVVLGTRPGSQPGEVQALGGSGAATASATFALNAVSEDADGITAVSGLDQSGPVGSVLASPLVVQVADAFGNPIPDVVVTWSVEGGGSVDNSTTPTDQSGQASVQRTLGPAAGTQRTLASVDGLAGSPVAFVHTAAAGAASGVSIVSGNGQRGPVSATLPQPLVVEVRDAQANLVPGVAVTWVIGSGGGSVAPPTAITDQGGRATATWTLGGSLGANTVSAVVSGIGVVQFTATATAGAPAQLSMRTQPSANAVSGVALPQQPVVELLDARGNPSSQSGVDVTVAIASGGGTLGGTQTRSTDGSGRATFTDLAITGDPGTRTLRFTAGSFTPVTSAPITVAAVPTVTAIISDAPNPSVAGTAVSVQFTVTSSAGTPTGSVTVADGSDNCTGALTNGAGSCSITLNTPGDRTLTASYPGGNGFGASRGTTGHTVQVPVQPPDPAQSSISANPASIPAGGSSAITVTVRDASGQPLAGRTVTVQAPGDGNSIVPASAPTGSDGTAAFTFSSTAAGTSPIISASADGVSLGGVPVTVESVPTSTSIIGTSPSSGTAPAGTTVTVSFTVTAASGIATGTVTVGSNMEGATCSAQVEAGSCALQLLTPGTHTLTATYTPNPGFAASSGTAAYEVTTGG